MYITPKIVFVEIPKTGSTYIDQILIELLDGRKVGKHNYPTNELLDSDRTFIASIRNPLDWYVSLWAYGCKVKHRSGPYNKTTHWRPLQLKGYGFDKNFWYGLLAYTKYLTKGSFANRNLWLNCYQDHGNPELFLEWLRLLFNPQTTYLYNAIYDQSPLSKYVGFYTFRYLWLTCKNRQELFSPNCPKTFEKLSEWETKNCYIKHFIRTENINEDLIRTLDNHGHQLSNAQKNHIYQSKRRNSSNRRRNFKDYFDEFTLDLIKRKDRLIFDKFGYLSSLKSISQSESA